jgi:hypothetical protein
MVLSIGYHSKMKKCGDSAVKYENMANEIYSKQISSTEKFDALKKLESIIIQDMKNCKDNTSIEEMHVALARCQYLIEELEKHERNADSEEETVKNKIAKESNNESAEVKKMVDISKATKK